MSNVATMPATIEVLTEREYRANQVVNGLKDRELTALQIGDEVIALISDMENWTKKEIENDDALRHIFKNEVIGDDLSKLAQWIEGHSPVKIKFDRKSAKFTGIGFDTKRKERCGQHELDTPVWDIKGMGQVVWTDYKPEIRKAPAAPNVQRGIDALVREAARQIDTDKTTTVLTIRDELSATLGKIEELVNKERAKTSHEEWITKFKMMNDKR